MKSWNISIICRCVGRRCDIGQYYKIVNIDKKQYIYGHPFGDGVKLLEFGDSAGGTMCALALLLADGNNRGGGDLHSDTPIIGSWAGDRIVIAGDYADEGNFLSEDELLGYGEEEIPTLYSYARSFYEDISEKIMLAMCEDTYLQRQLFGRLIASGWRRESTKNEYPALYALLVKNPCCGECHRTLKSMKELNDRGICKTCQKVEDFRRMIREDEDDT